LHGRSKSIFFGFYKFGLERQKALRAINDLAKYMTAKELNEEQISLLISCGAVAMRNELYGLAFKDITKAIFISPYLVMLELRRRDFFRRLLRKLGRMFIGG
jgi:hypothetical protein